MDQRMMAVLVQPWWEFSLPPLSSVTMSCPKIIFLVFCRSHLEFNSTAKLLIYDMKHKNYSGNNFCTLAKFSALYSLLHQKYLTSATSKFWKGNHIYTSIIIISHLPCSSHTSRSLCDDLPWFLLPVSL
jgi:hypothetical protein